MISDIFSLKDKVALITGSGRGIGAAIAKLYAEAGAAVVVTARTQNEIDAVAAEISNAGGKAIAISVDFNNLDQLPAMVERVVSELGGLDIIVNNAGGGTSSAFVDTRVEEIESKFHLGVSAPFELSRLALPHLLERPGANIINTLSPGAYLAPRGNLSYYVAKAALSHMTKLMAADLGPRVRVNGIIPGPVETPALKELMATRGDAFREMVTGSVRMRRLAQPEDIAYGALYLASPAASFVTGALLPVNGGDVDEMRPISPDL